MIQNSNKKIAKNTIYLYLRMIVSLLINLYTSRAFLETLGVEDYGIYNIVGGFVTLLSIITNSLTMSAQRFITYFIGEGNKEKLRKIFSTFTSLFIILAISIILFGILIGPPLLEKFLVIPNNRIEAAIFTFYCSLIAFSLNLIAIPYIAIIIAYEKMDFYALASIFETSLKLLIVYLLYTISYDRLKTYALLLVIVGVIIRIIYGVYCSISFQETKFQWFFDRNHIKEIFSFSSWMAIGSIVVIAKEQGVNLLINQFCGVSINAARAISMQINNVINQFASNIASAINPQITKSYASGEIQRSIKLTFALTKVQGIMLLLIALPLYFQIDYILSIWLKDVPYYTNIFTRWIIILCFITTLRNTYASFYLATGNIKTLQWSSSLIYILNLPLSYIALKLGYEPSITIQIAVIIEVITWFYSYYYLYLEFRFPLKYYTTRVIIPLIIITILSAYILHILQKYFNLSNGILNLFLLTLLNAITIITMSYLILLEKKEKKFIKEFISTKFNFLK